MILITEGTNRHGSILHEREYLLSVHVAASLVKFFTELRCQLTIIRISQARTS